MWCSGPNGCCTRRLATLLPGKSRVAASPWRSSHLALYLVGRTQHSLARRCCSSSPDWLFPGRPTCGHTFQNFCRMLIRHPAPWRHPRRCSRLWSAYAAGRLDPERFRRDVQDEVDDESDLASLSLAARFFCCLVQGRFPPPGHLGGGGKLASDAALAARSVLNSPQHQPMLGLGVGRLGSHCEAWQMAARRLAGDTR